VLAWLALACAGGDIKDTADPDNDGDGDGYALRYDCDDTDPAVYPTADEVCDGIDNNCDGQIDDATAIDGETFYADADGDGYGNPASSTTTCSPPPGFIVTPDDCDDTNAAANPGAAEVCDGADNDCDGEADNDPTDATTWYPDGDGDGYGLTDKATEGCAPGAGWVTTADDCDDSDSSAYPGAAEICNDGRANDCDGTVEAARATCGWPSSRDEDDASAILSPGSATGQPGWAIAAGDLNADGNVDLLVGSPGDDAAWTVLGPITASQTTSNSPALTGTGAGLAVGIADADDDGYLDILVGGSGAWIQHGPAMGGGLLSDADLHIDGEAAALATATLSGGLTLLVGAPGDATVYLFSASATGALTHDDATATLDGPANTGATLASAGDLDGDGLDELLIGAPSASGGGAAWLVSGPITGSQSLSTGDAWTASGWASLMGTALAGLGDIDGDGYDDFAIGAPAADIYSGALGLWRGGKALPSPEDVTDADMVITGDIGMLFGGTAQAAGDIDLDGQPDVVVGSGYGIPSGGSAPVEDGPAEAYLFCSGGALAGLSGTIDHTSADVTFEGPQRAFGLRAAGIGDISGDGRPDLFFSSGEEEEESYLFFSSSE